MQQMLLVAPPVEPITLDEAKRQCGFGPIEDSDRQASEILAQDLRDFMRDARKDIENHTRLALITQTWGAKYDAFPGRDFRYLPTGYAALLLPKPPLQSIVSFQYVDTSGQLQTLLQDTTYGVNPAAPEWGYQLDRGGEERPSKLIVSYPKIWPPTRMVPANVLIKFRCGYGGPLKASMTQGSAILTGPVFNPDDAPLLPLETGLAVSIPGAGPNGGPLLSNIVSVDSNGQATIAANAVATVADVMGWFGLPVPGEITRAVKLMTQFYYEQSCGRSRQDLKDTALDLINPCRNLVS